MTWAETLRIEVKITTSEAVPVPARELGALATSSDNELGILAVLFWCGDRNVDGRWLIADASEIALGKNSQSVSVSKTAMERADRGQSWLGELKQHLADLWPRFLHAFYDDAMLGHEVLCGVLKHAHEHEGVLARLPTERVLETDHRDAVRNLIEHHGESVAGHIFQDLLAYLIGHAGYSTVTLNPVGVPDITISGYLGARDVEPESVELGRFSVEDARQLLRYCEEAENQALAALIRGRLFGI